VTCRSRRAGAQAELIDPGSLKLVRTVRLVDLQHPTCQAIERAVRANPWLGISQAADYQVEVNACGEIEIWDGAGPLIENLRPPIRADDPRAAPKVVARLEHLARYAAVRQLDNRDRGSRLSGKLDVVWAGWQEEYDPTKELMPFEDGDVPTVPAGAVAVLRVRNRSSQVLNVTVLDLQPDWGIGQIYPWEQGDYFIPLDPGQEQLFPIQMWLPEGYGRGTDTFKVFATPEAVNFRWLELPALDQPVTRSADLRGGPTNGLEALLAAITADRPTRTGSPLLFGGSPWATAQVELTVEGGSD